MIEISVIIVAYINWRDLGNTLSTMDKYNDLGNSLEVIVVDNSPYDQRVEKYIQSKYSYQYRYIKSDNNGFGAGNNVGAKVAHGRILAFINPDVLFVQPILKKIVKIFDDPDTVLAGCRLTTKNGGQNSSFKYVYKSSVLSKQVIKVLNRMGIYDYKTMYIEGADMFVRKSAFNAVGGFDENIFMYYEEADLIKRLQEKFPTSNGKFQKNLVLVHLENGSTPNSEFAIKTQLESCVYFGKKYDLDYRRKINDEYRYLKLKSLIFKLLHKDNKYLRELQIYQEFMARNINI